MTARRVLSAGKGKNKLPWEGERGGDGEGGAGDVVPFAKGVEQVCAAGPAGCFFQGGVP